MFYRKCLPGSILNLGKLYIYDKKTKSELRFYLIICFCYLLRQI